MAVNYKIMTSEPLLTKAIKSVETSVEFEHMCAENKFYTFGDLLIHDTNQLLSKPGFNYRMLMELFGFLSSINKKHLLRD
jgi:hypothetical protein